MRPFLIVHHRKEGFMKKEKMGVATAASIFFWGDRIRQTVHLPGRHNNYGNGFSPPPDDVPDSSASTLPFHSSHSMSTSVSPRTARRPLPPPVREPPPRKRVSGMKRTRTPLMRAAVTSFSVATPFLLVAAVK